MIKSLPVRRHSPITISRQMFQELSLGDDELKQQSVAAYPESPHVFAVSSSCAAAAEDKVSAIRRRMVQRLYRRLERLPKLQQQQQQPDSQGDKYKAAQFLERYLYKTSPLQEYQDWNIIKERLRSMLAIRLCLRSLQEKNKKNKRSGSAIRGGVATNNGAQQQQPFPPSRSAVLKEVLKDHYHETATLVQSIQSVKLQQVVSLKGCCSQSACRLVRTHYHHHHYKSDFDGQFPDPLKNIFFHTPLVQAFEKTPVEKLDTLPWPQMFQEARRNLKAFEEYNRNEGKL
jgi:hypothetical protein